MLVRKHVRKRTPALRDSRQRDTINRIEKLRVKIINPELIEVAEDGVRRAFWNDVTPIIEELIVIAFQFFPAPFHLYEHTIRPQQISELLPAFGFRRSAVALDQFQLR